MNRPRLTRHDVDALLAAAAHEEALRQAQRDNRRELLVVAVMACLGLAVVLALKTGWLA
ncbi:hypothetical protein WAE61_03400 [Comamonadaceae bacterium PP-2]